MDNPAFKINLPNTNNESKNEIIDNLLPQALNLIKWYIRHNQSYIEYEDLEGDLKINFECAYLLMKKLEELKIIKKNKIICDKETIRPEYKNALKKINSSF